MKKCLITRNIISSLATCNFMNLNTNLVIHGSSAIASEAIKQRHKTLYIKLPRLLELYDNMRNSGKSLSQTVQMYAKYEMSDQDKQFISKLIEIRHDTYLTIFCSQYPTED